MPVFQYQSELPYPRERVFAWHLRPGALERLLPPWADAQVVHREGTIEDGGRVHVKMRHGPIPILWKARHTGFERNRFFRDEQESGPMRSWVHRHDFEVQEDGGTLVRDRISWEPPLAAPGQAAGLLSRPVVERELNRLFTFRHQRLAQDLARHEAYPGKSLTVAVTGASGLVGSALCSFLTTGGHATLRLVRKKPDHDNGELSWEPSRGQIEADRLEGVDAIVHLAGANLAQGRWTPARKREIWKSRIEGTRLLVNTINQMRRPPSVFVSSSAIGFYGNRGTERLDEHSAPGKGFLAELCQEWEEEALKARRSGVRVVLLRTGMVLSPAGGALGTMLLPFQLGVGGRLGSGRQYVSWVDHDDLVALIFHALTTDSVRGPLNATAPYPVPNATFTTVLGQVLHRPTLLPVPSLAIRTLFGEMGQALLLDGARVQPEAAARSGFRFDCEGLEESLRFQLGRKPRRRAT